MAILAWRAKQSTDTTGTGTLALNAAGAAARSFNAAFGGSAILVRYCISYASGFELGIGSYSGGAPGSLTRATVLASSNAGALVSLPAGTKDVFAWIEPSERRTLAITGTATAALADLGNTVLFTGSAAATLNLPALAGVPEGASLLVINRGTSLAVLTIDPNGAETVGGNATLPIIPGESVELIARSAGWETVGEPRGWRFIAQALPAAAAAADFVLPNGAFSQYRLVIANLRNATDVVSALLRFSNNGGSSFFSGATDYSTALGYLSGVAALTGQGSQTSGIALTPVLDATSQLTGEFTVTPGATGIYPSVSGTSVSLFDTGVLWSSMHGGGIYNTTGACNAIRVQYSTGNITSGSLTLMGLR